MFSFLSVAGVAAAGVAPTNYTVLQNTDFYGYNSGGHAGCKTFAACAQACSENPNCKAASWNGPDSPYKDLNCNFHCSTAGKRTSQGEVAAVIRGGTVPCAPPAPRPPPAPTPGPAVPIPAAWLAREASSNMYIANMQPLVVGNGFVAAMTRTGTMHVAGVFSGDLDRTGKEPVRADMPSFWDGFAIGSYGGDFASALDVGVSAVYSIGALPGGATLEARRYAHRSMPHVVGVDFTFDNSKGKATLLSNISQPGSWGGSAATLSTKTTAWTHSSSSAAAAAAGASCWSGQVAMSEDVTLPLTHLGLCTTLHAAPLPVSVPAGATQTVTVLAAIYTTLKTAGDPLALATADLKTAAALSVEARWAAHVGAVDLALEGGIEITGNHDLAKLVNSSFHTLVAALRAEPEFWYSSSPGGLATDCYNGHTFWDMETWMYPNLLFFHPKLATGTVMYRVNGLDWAKKWATNTSRNGARYPWQTATSGKVASHANEAEIHIVGDVALSMWQYYSATHNATWLKAHGLPVLAATAEFFADWAVKNVDGSFSLNKTQGPDEFHTGDDSCYVNAAAALNLRSAANFCKMLKKPVPANWTAIADGVRIPFDAKRQLHLEFAEWTDSMKAKQADTIMLSYPLGVAMPPAVRKNDLVYYANHTGNGPSMTWSMYAIGFLETGELEQASSFFNRSWLPYVDRKTGDFGGDCGGNFLTGAGGFLQGLWVGWAGMRLRLDTLDFLTPRVPATTDGMKLRGVTYLGSKFDLRIRPEKAPAGQAGACFRGWPVAAGGVQLKVGVLGGGSFVPLSATEDACFKLGTSMRIVGE